MQDGDQTLQRNAAMIPRMIGIEKDLRLSQVPRDPLGEEKNKRKKKLGEKREENLSLRKEKLI